MRRYAIGAVLFIIAMFCFFVGYAVSSYLLDKMGDALLPFAATLSTTNATDNITLLATAFGVICAIIAVLIIIVFFMDVLADDPDLYYRER